MDIPDFSLWGAAGVRGKIGIMSQKGPFLILFWLASYLWKWLHASK
jgi:hypothetical protein